MSGFRDSEKYKAALEKLPEELKPIYEDLVEQYRFHTFQKYGQGYVAYEILALLVLDGWRCSVKPLK